MRVLMVALAVVVVASACGTSCSPDPQVCEQAVDRYLNSGCFYVDGSPPVVATKENVVGLCEQAQASATGRCQLELDAWITCQMAAPDRATANSDCNCAELYVSMQSCQ